MWVQVAALRCTTLSARAGRLPGTHPGHIQPDAQKFELRWRRPPPPRRRHAYGSQGWSLEANLGGRALRARRALANAHSDLRAAEPASPNLKHAPPAAAPGPARCGVRPAPSLHGALLLPRRRRDLAPLPSSRRRGRRRRAARALELRCLLPAASSPPVSSRRPGSLLRDPPPSNIRPAGRTRPYDPIPASCARLQGQRVIVVLPSQALPLEGADGCCLLARACCARSVRAGPAGCGWWKGPPLPSAVALCNTLGRRRRAGPVLGRLAVSSQRFVLS